MSFVVGAYVYSFSYQLSSCTARSSVVSGLSTVFSNCRFSSSQAATLTIEGAFPAPNQLFQMRICAGKFSSLYLNAGTSAGSNVRSAISCLF